MKAPLFTDQRAVTAAGTPERLVEGPGSNQVIAITIRANTGNAGNIYVAPSEVVNSITTDGYILTAGEIVSLDISRFFDMFIDLNELWIDAAVNGDGISFVAVRLP